MKLDLAKLRERLGSASTSAVSNVGEGIGRVDDSVQGAARYLIGERDGEFPDTKWGNARRLYTDVMHPYRNELDAEPLENAMVLGGSRALQAGLITAAGAGLLNLTNEFYNRYEGADYQEPGQLHLQ